MRGRDWNREQVKRKDEEEWTDGKRTRLDNIRKRGGGDMKNGEE